jgi:hypothetical protein
MMRGDLRALSDCYLLEMMDHHTNPNGQLHPAAFYFCLR